MVPVSCSYYNSNLRSDDESVVTMREEELACFSADVDRIVGGGGVRFVDGAEGRGVGEAERELLKSRGVGREAVWDPDDLSGLSTVTESSGVRGGGKGSLLRLAGAVTRSLGALALFVRARFATGGHINEEADRFCCSGEQLRSRQRRRVRGDDKGDRMSSVSLPDRRPEHRRRD